jgi:hypothetical protein
MKYQRTEMDMYMAAEKKVMMLGFASLIPTLYVVFIASGDN